MSGAQIEVEQEICESRMDGGRAADMEVDDDGSSKRTGTVWTASAHIITAIVGSGVLSLAWAIAQLGWITGLATLLIFSGISLYTSALLADCSRAPRSGKRNYTYREAVKSYLGGRKYKVCGLVQYIILCGMSVGYTITASISIVAMRRSICFHKRGHEAPCNFSNIPYMTALGITEIFLSQIQNFHKLSWLSTVAAVMSFSYAGIGMGLAFAKIVSGHGEKTSLTGVEIGPALTAADKTWSMFTAIGDMAFSCSYSAILIEIQDTLRSSPPENEVMKKANMIATITATTLYVICSCLGYSALGNNAGGNMLTSFGFYEPFWLIDLANFCIVVHLLGAYQVVVQPVFNAFESWASMRWPKSKFITNEYPLSIGKNHFKFSVNFFRLIWRTFLVMMATLLSMAFPFFNEILALLGAFAYWPMTVYFPVEMHIVQKNINRGTVKWLGLQLLNFLCFLASFVAACSSIQGLTKALHTFKPFNIT